jgi:hypothetical protein
MKISPTMIVLVAFAVAVNSCSKEEDNTHSYSKELKPFSDATITNSTPRTIADNFNGANGKALWIGWDYEGPAMRSFITFDITSILPAEDEEIIIESAVLKVYEENTNLLPFDGNNEVRTVEAYLLDYQNLDFNDFDLAPIAHCGTLATWGYKVLEEHSLDVTSVISDYLNTSTETISQVQFRLQFTDDTTVPQTDNSGYDGGMWCIFAREDNSEYVPKLSIEYTIRPK